MATSGSYDYNLTAANVITVALENLGILGGGASTDANDSTLCLRRLNMIAKQYQGRAYGGPGIPIHTRQRVTLMMAVGQQTYSVGPASGDARASTLVGRTTISANEAAGQTVLSITSNTDTTTYPGTTITMAGSDIVGIELNDGTIQWTTISGTPAATMTVAVALTGASDAGKYVWWVTARAQRFPILESAVLRDENRIDTPLDVYTDVREYQLGVTDKYADGQPTALLFEPLRITSRITLNSQPTDITSQIVLTVLYPAEDYDATTDDVAFPQEALRFLGWELAFEIHASFGAVWTDSMEKARNEARATWLGLNPDNSVLFFQRD